MNIIRKACAQANFRSGRQGHAVDAVIIHVIDGSQASCDATFASSSLDLKRSAHYSVGRDGEIHQYVDEQDTAFHAGRIQQPTWQGLKALTAGGFVNPNLHTIGIEHAGRADDPWLDTMYDTTAELIAGIAARHPNFTAPFSTANIGLHRQIFSGKTCPGSTFQLATLIARIPQVVPAVPAPRVTAPSIVTIERPVRVREGAPNTTSPIRSVLSIGRQVAPLNVQNGEAVAGNPHWYELDSQGFIWAGATDHP
jgi:N-acetylmuramoyl-L-alanine amidase